MRKALLLLTVVACVAGGCKKEEAKSARLSKKNGLIAKIREQPEARNIGTKEGTVEAFIRDINKPPKPAPVVSLEGFFEGNEDEGSIGCNLVQHPGIDSFYRVLKQIRGRDDVQDVLIEIYEFEDEYADWPFSESVYIVTSATKEDVTEWMQPLQPDEIGEGWTGGRPSAAPEVKEGYKVYRAWWD